MGEGGHNLLSLDDGSSGRRHCQILLKTQQRFSVEWFPQLPNTPIAFTSLKNIKPYFTKNKEDRRMMKNY